MAYPIVELKDPLDLRRYVRTLEAAIIDTAAAFGVAGERLDRAIPASGSTASESSARSACA